VTHSESTKKKKKKYFLFRMTAKKQKNKRKMQKKQKTDTRKHTQTHCPKRTEAQKHGHTCGPQPRTIPDWHNRQAIAASTSLLAVE
jgi:hypothetical protein